MSRENKLGTVRIRFRVGIQRHQLLHQSRMQTGIDLVDKRHRLLRQLAKSKREE